MSSRREVIGAGAIGALSILGAAAIGRTSATTLLTGPIETFGDWGHMVPASVHIVLERMRHACLDGIRLVSDAQPERLRVEEHTSGPPAVWLHSQPETTGWIIVDVGERDWSQLAYQFGHELGHVTANSWRPDAKPGGPCQWLEEAMVEAFSLRGLSRLADGWSRDPPFVGDSAFGTAIATYRQTTLEGHARLAERQGHADDPSAWFTAHRAEIEARPYLSDFAKAASLTLLAEYERDPATLVALGALNRWAGRGALPLEDYLGAWRTSCAELGAAPVLPTRLRELLIPRAGP